MYGKFIKDTAGFEINTFDLPTSWEYIYENKDILLKVDQYGPAYAQANSPGDILLFKREQHYKYSPWVIDVKSEEEQFTNFLRPNRLGFDIEAEDVKIEYRPECAKYSFSYKNLYLETEIFIPRKGTKIIYKFKIKNIGESDRKLKIRPHLIPYLNDAVMAPWDKYEWYLDSTCEKSELITFKTKLLDANAKTENRRCLRLSSTATELEGYELSLEKYIGKGDISLPQQNYYNEDRIYSYPPVYAMSYDWELEAGEEKELTQILSLDDENYLGYFDNEKYISEKTKRKNEFDCLFNKNRIKTGNEDFDYYANYWIPLQMNWVASLDRGWPTGMRGSRDSAQDYSALLYTDTESCKGIILTMLECQETNGWFPRQYSANGKHGKHDLRKYVDSGAFFIEFLWKYLAHTRDFGILNEKIAWLDSDNKSSVLEHLISAAQYYMRDENIGEHGLCKIYEGDWLDAVNRAGLEGRGESVTVSEQMVMGIKYLLDILKTVDYKCDFKRYSDFADKLKENINKYAFNKGNFYNGVFNDDGRWIFSENDPDGEVRIYGVSNYYAVISGVAKKDKYPHILNVMDNLKCDMGYRLFYPPLGIKPIGKVGRVASGDMPEFMIENGNVYNHGSHGFLARALSIMGEGDRLFEALKLLMPYDTNLHPTEKTFTPPYAIVNCYQQLPEFHHRGLMCFLTGSVAMAMRGVYEWMLGIRPCLDGIEIEPCLAKEINNAEVKLYYMGKTLDFKFTDEEVFINNRKLSNYRNNMITENKALYVSYEDIIDIAKMR